MNDEEINESEEQEETEDPEHKLEDWVVVFESPDFLEADLVEARFSDENIEYYTINKQDIGYTVEIGSYWTYNAGKPITIFVRPEVQDRAIAIIEEDRSKMLDDPNLDFGEQKDQ